MEIVSKSLLNINSQSVAVDYDPARYASSMVFRTGMVMLGEVDTSDFSFCTNSCGGEFKVETFKNVFDAKYLGANGDYKTAEQALKNVLNRNDLSLAQKQDLKETLIPRIQNHSTNHETGDYIFPESEIGVADSNSNAARNFLTPTSPSPSPATTVTPPPPASKEQVTVDQLAEEQDPRKQITLLNKLETQQKGLKDAAEKEINVIDANWKEGTSPIEYGAKLKELKRLEETTKERAANLSRLESTKKTQEAELEKIKRDAYKEAEKKIDAASLDANGQAALKKATDALKTDGLDYKIKVQNGLNAINAEKDLSADQKEIAARKFLSQATKADNVNLKEIRELVNADSSWTKGLSIGEKGKVTGLTDSYYKSTVLADVGVAGKISTQEQAISRTKSEIENINTKDIRNLENLRSEFEAAKDRKANLQDDIKGFDDNLRLIGRAKTADGKVDKEAYATLLAEFGVPGSQLAYSVDPKTGALVRANVPPMLKGEELAKWRERQKDRAYADKLDYYTAPDGTRMVRGGNDNFTDKDIKVEAQRVMTDILKQNNGRFDAKASKDLEQYIESKGFSPQQRDLFLKSVFDDSTFFKANLADKLYDDKGQQAEAAKFLRRQGYKLDGVEGGIFSRERVNFHKEVGVGANTPAFGAAAQAGRPGSGQQAQARGFSADDIVKLTNTFTQTMTGISNMAIQLGNRNRGVPTGSYYGLSNQERIIAQRNRIAYVSSAEGRDEYRRRNLANG